MMLISNVCDYSSPARKTPLGHAWWRAQQWGVLHCEREGRRWGVCVFRYMQRLLYGCTVDVVRRIDWYIHPDEVDRYSTDEVDRYSTACIRVSTFQSTKQKTGEVERKTAGSPSSLLYNPATSKYIKGTAASLVDETLALSVPNGCVHRSRGRASDV